MRECPNCHYVDPPYWLPRLWDREIDIIKVEDLRKVDPELESKIPPKGEYDDGLNVYRRVGPGVIWRMWGVLRRVRNWSPPKGYWDGATRKNFSRFTSNAAKAANSKRKIPRLDAYFGGKTPLPLTSKVLKVRVKRRRTPTHKA